MPCIVKTFVSVDAKSQTKDTCNASPKKQSVTILSVEGKNKTDTKPVRNIAAIPSFL